MLGTAIDAMKIASTHAHSLRWYLEICGDEMAISLYFSAFLPLAWQTAIHSAIISHRPLDGRCMTNQGQMCFDVVFEQPQAADLC